MLKIVLILVLLVVLLGGGIFAFMQFTKSNQSAVPNPEPIVQKTLPEMAVVAGTAPLPATQSSTISATTVEQDLTTIDADLLTIDADLSSITQSLNE